MKKKKIAENTQKILVTKNKVLNHALKRILGPGVRKAIERNDKMPDKFSGTDGIIFDPNWQDDVIDEQTLKKSRK